ncbi:hypothetical protein [Thalassoroseus pseudoceratinae]|uniref:hypothetical protein n=1 Tax=Thalassoroseus pseudoceratinae TaxID=2713176 RepID=UPI00141D93B1|nr:hypothetical protein [Thalassoroseus pseudoceratinae]
MSNSQPSRNDVTNSSEANVENLLARMSSADRPDAEFVTRLQTEMCQEAKRLADSRAAKLPAANPFRWRFALPTVAAVAVVFLLGYWVGVQHNQTVDHPIVKSRTLVNASDETPAPPNTMTKPISVAVMASPRIPFHRQLTTVGPENAVCLSYDDLAVPPKSSAAGLNTQKLQPLSGQRVRIRGFMRPSFEETDLTRFWLARDNQFCCFGPNPKLCDIIRVTLRDGSTTDYIEGRPFDVVGVLHIDSKTDDQTPELLTLNDAIVVSR